MADDLDFADLNTTNPFVPLLAGGIAGILEHTVMYPIDSVKTRMQILSDGSSYNSVRSVIRHMIKNEGILSPYRGILAVIMGAGPAHALYFGSYEFAKKTLPKLQFGVKNDSFMQYGMAGLIATFLHDASINPVEVVKQRLQMDNMKYKGISHCVKCVYKTEGIFAFYRSLPIQLLMNIPFSCVNFVTYETTRKFLYDRIHNNPKKYKCHSFHSESKLENDLEAPFNSFIHLFAGSVSGALAAAITNPIDVVKTHLNTQVVSEESSTKLFCRCSSNISTSDAAIPLKNTKKAVIFIYNNWGFAGFLKGISARIIYTTPSVAICWSVYEFFKLILN